MKAALINCFHAKIDSLFQMAENSVSTAGTTTEQVKKWKQMEFTRTHYYFFTLRQNIWNVYIRCMFQVSSANNVRAID